MPLLSAYPPWRKRLHKKVGLAGRLPDVHLNDKGSNKQKEPCQNPSGSTDQGDPTAARRARHGNLPRLLQNVNLKVVEDAALLEPMLESGKDSPSVVLALTKQWGCATNPFADWSPGRRNFPTNTEHGSFPRWMNLARHTTKEIILPAFSLDPIKLAVLRITSAYLLTASKSGLRYRVSHTPCRGKQRCGN